MTNHHMAFKKTEPDLDAFTWEELKNTISQRQKADAQDLQHELFLKITHDKMLYLGTYTGIRTHN